MMAALLPPSSSNDCESRGIEGVDASGGSLVVFDGVTGKGDFGSRVCGCRELGCMFSVSIVE
jgi:hypothetical protein